MLTVYSIPALESNYFWLLQPVPEEPDAYILDPGDAQPVMDCLHQHQLRLAGIIITHHHWDHTDGIDELLAHFPVPVYGPDSRRIPQVTHNLQDGDTLELPGLRLEVLAVPGHTLDHLAYLHTDSRPAKLFCGDSLFAGGCGRMFEGQPEQMLASLNKLAALPEDTLVYCSHEYTLPNLQFALKVEPDNKALTDRLQTVQQIRQQHLSTLPSTIAIERRTNPFLRCHLPAIKAAAEQHIGSTLTSDASVFAVIRRWKDQA
ncbi:MAG TPA: hydroxyacylglutathione hydrolase [Cellvibrio sp.]|nr:hydroxyacylglutathione hydrolase [Cellvibrio sp.]